MVVGAGDHVDQVRAGEVAAVVRVLGARDLPGQLLQPVEVAARQVHAERDGVRLVTRSDTVSGVGDKGSVIRWLGVCQIGSR